MDTDSLLQGLLHQIAEILIPLAAASLGPVAAWAIAFARRWYVNQAVARALLRGAGVAYMTLIEERQGVGKAAIAQAVERGAEFVLGGNAPLAAAKVDGTRLRELVHAEVGKLLAADPGVSAASPR